MSWTQEEMDKLYMEVQKKAMTDAGFRKELLEDTNTALEKVAGKKLPEGCNIKVIENDPAYTATMVIPDLVTEEFSAEDLDQISGGMDKGISFFLILSACAVAVAVAGCPADACAAQGCVADNVCGGQACAAKGTVV